MDRRTFVSLVAGTCLLDPFAVRAQTTGRVARIGLLAPYTEPTPGGRIDLEDLRKRFAGDSRVRDMLFRRYVAGPGVAAAFREATAPSATPTAR